MNDERSPEAGPWDDDDEDNEKTQVARNPLLGPPPDKMTAETSAIVERRNVGTQGPVQKTSAMPPVKGSLYERLLRSGTLDEIMALDAAKKQAAQQREEASELKELVPRQEPPPGLSSMPSLADELEPGSGLFIPPNELELSDERPSTEPLRDSEIQVLTSRDSGGFVRALAEDPDVDEPPAVARFKRPAPEPPAVPEPPPVQAPKAEPPPPSPPAVPSVVLSPQLSTRQDATERISTAAAQPPAPVNSVAPTAAPKSEVPPGPRRASGLWFGLGAAALVALGIGLTRMNLPQEVERSAGAQPADRGASVPSDDVAAAPAPVAPLAAEPPQAAPEEPAERAEAAPSAPSEQAKVKADAEELTPEERARQLRHERRARRAQERAEAEARAAAEPPEGAAASEAPADAPATNAAESPREAPSVAPAVAPSAPPTSTGAEEGLAQPSREQVIEAMNAVLPRLKECVGDKHGLADVTMTVRSAGFVSYAMVAGTFAGTPEGSCIAKVVKEARFPPFTEPFVRITYPFQL